MLKYLTILIIAAAIVPSHGQTWASRARLEGHVQYWGTLMQELVNELETREWCNLKLDDITQTIDDNLYNMHVNGSVQYTNGFVVSIQKIDVVNIHEGVTSMTFEGEEIIRGNVGGRLNFRDVLIGFDVSANLTSPAGVYRSTGTFLHTLVQVELELSQTLRTKELTIITRVSSVTTTGTGVRMHYMPSSNVTEALGRRFSPSTFDSANKWANDIFAPIVLDLATNKIEFPKVCFNNCS